MSIQYLILYMLMDSTIGHLLAYFRFESALFFAAIVWHLGQSMLKREVKMSENKQIMPEGTPAWFKKYKHHLTAHEMRLRTRSAICAKIQRL